MVFSKKMGFSLKNPWFSQKQDFKKPPYGVFRDYRPLRPMGNPLYFNGFTDKSGDNRLGRKATMQNTEIEVLMCIIMMSLYDF